jgi:endonuclease V-like protein UPF0215 family
MDGVLRSEITRDGMDATDVIAEMATATRHYPQIRVIMLDGVTYGGFNVVDITKLQRRTGLPIIVVMRSEPDMGRIRDAMQNLPDADRRWQSIQSAGRIHEIEVHDNLLYIQCAGIDPSKVLAGFTRSRCMTICCTSSAQESRLRMQGRSCNSQQLTATSLSRSV